jgi:hypothetical protein
MAVHKAPHHKAKEDTQQHSYYSKPPPSPETCSCVGYPGQDGRAGAPGPPGADGAQGVWVEVVAAASRRCMCLSPEAPWHTVLYGQPLPNTSLASTTPATCAHHRASR